MAMGVAQQAASVEQRDSGKKRVHSKAEKDVKRTKQVQRTAMQIAETPGKHEAEGKYRKTTIIIKEASLNRRFG